MNLEELINNVLNKPSELLASIDQSNFSVNFSTFERDLKLESEVNQQPKIQKEKSKQIRVSSQNEKIIQNNMKKNISQQKQVAHQTNQPNMYKTQDSNFTDFEQKFAEQKQMI